MALGRNTAIDEETLVAALSQAAPDAVVIVDDQGGIVYANQQAELLFGYSADELLGEAIEVLVPDRVKRAHVGMRDGYVRHPETRPMGTGRDLHARRKDGRTFPVDVSLAAIDSNGRRYVTAFVRDATDWRRRHKQAAATAELSNALLEGRDVVEVLTLAAEHARAVVGADQAWVVAPKGDVLVVRAGAGTVARELVGTTVPLNASVSGMVLETAAPIIVDSATDDPRVAESVRALGFGPALFVPLVAGERRFGAMVVARRQDEPMFSDGDVATARLFAGSAAIALAFGETRTELEHQRFVAEQERIGRELLNRVVHDLYAVGLSLQSGVGLATPQVAARLDDAVTRLDGVIRELRAVVFGMVERDEASTDPTP